APAAHAFLAAVTNDGIPIAIRLGLVICGDLKRKGFVMFEHRTAVEANAGNAGNFKLDRQHVALLAGRIVTGRAMDGAHGAVGKGFGIKSGSGLGILIVPEANRVLRHCMSFRSEARLNRYAMKTSF